MNSPAIVHEEFKNYWIPGLSNDAYHADHTALSSTSAVRMLESPRAFYRWAILGKKTKPTDAMRFGSAVHLAMLEPQKFKDTYVLEPKFIGKTLDGRDSPQSKEAKAQKAAWYASLPHGTEVVSPEDLDSLRNMIDALLEHRDARKILTGATFERAGFARDPITGILLKIKPDVLSANYAILSDLKTARTITKRKFASVIWEKGYYFQLAFYRYVTHLITGVEPSVMPIIAVQNEEPYDVAVYPMDVGMISRGEQAVRYALDKIAHCMKTENWPGIQPDGQAEDISLPAWTDAIEEGIE